MSDVYTCASIRLSSMTTFGSWLEDDSLRSPPPDEVLHLNMSLSPVPERERGRADSGGVRPSPCFNDTDDGDDDTGSALSCPPAAEPLGTRSAAGPLASRAADGCGDRARRIRSATANRLSSWDIRPAWARRLRRDPGLRRRDDAVRASIIWYSCSAVGPGVLGVLGGGRADVGVGQADVGVVAGVVSSSSSSAYGTASESIADTDPCWLPPLPAVRLCTSGPVTVVVGRPWRVSRWRVTAWCSGLLRCCGRGDDGMPPTFYNDKRSRYVV